MVIKCQNPMVFIELEFYGNSNAMLWSIARGTGAGRCKKHYDSGNHKSVNPAFTQGTDVKKKSINNGIRWIWINTTHWTVIMFLALEVVPRSFTIIYYLSGNQQVNKWTWPNRYSIPGFSRKSSSFWIQEET